MNKSVKLSGYRILEGNVPEPSQYKAKFKKKKDYAEERIYEGSIYLIEKIIQNLCKIQNILIKIVTADTLPVWTKKGKKIQIKKNSKILLTERKCIKFSSKPMLFSVKKNE